MDGDFPGVTSKKETWYYPFANNVPNYASNINNIRLQYKISSQANGDGLTTRYNLTIYKSGTDNVLGQYHCNSDERMWIKD